MENKTKKQVQIAIIGGGPAGISAAIHLVRSKFDFILISENLGGTIRNANKIENLLGFPNSITGESFVNLIQQQIASLDIPFLRENVLTLRRVNEKYEINCKLHRIEADYVIVATGTTPRTLNIEGEKEAISHGFLFYEVASISRNLQEKSIIVIGSGDIAYDYAFNLHSLAKSITILQRSSVSNSLKLLQERVSQISKIKIIKDTSVIEIKSMTNSVQCILESSEGTHILNSDMILVAIGRIPNISILSKELLSEYQANIICNSLKFVGDVHTGIFRQVSIAMGEGMKAAMEITQSFTHLQQNQN